jgi:hypothetical protein
MLMTVIVGIWGCDVAQEAQENLDTLDTLGGKSCQQTSAARLDIKAVKTAFMCKGIGEFSPTSKVVQS